MGGGDNDFDPHTFYIVARLSLGLRFGVLIISGNCIPFVVAFIRTRDIISLLQPLLDACEDQKRLLRQQPPIAARCANILKDNLVGVNLPPVHKILLKAVFVVVNLGVRFVDFCLQDVFSMDV